MMKPAMSPTLQTLTYSAAGAPFLVGRSAACALATTTRVAAEPSRRLFITVIILRPPVSCNRELSAFAPLPQSPFSVASAGRPASRQTSESRPGNPVHVAETYAPSGPLQTQNSRLFASIGISRGYVAERSRTQPERALLSQPLCVEKTCLPKKSGGRETDSTDFRRKASPGPQRRQKRAPELALRGLEAWLDCDVDQNERTMCRRALKPSALFWNTPLVPVVQPTGVV